MCLEVEISGGQAIRIWMFLYFSGKSCLVILISVKISDSQMFQYSWSKNISLIAKQKFLCLEVGNSRVARLQKINVFVVKFVWKSFLFQYSNIHSWTESKFTSTNQ